MNRKSRSSRRSSILKIDVNYDEDTRNFEGRSRRSLKRVSFAEKSQVKVFAKDSPQRWNDDHENGDGGSGKSNEIQGLDKLLSGTVQTPYQDVLECPIPEMSAESFSLFDINKTVLDDVDMDMTECHDNQDIVLPSHEQHFTTEPSIEIKFDASSILKNLQPKSSDRLTPMQIYSPKHDDPPLSSEDTYPSVFSSMCTASSNLVSHNKENVPIQLGATARSQSGRDLWAMLQKNFQRAVGGTQAGNIEPEVQEDEAMEETACYDGGIVTGIDMLRSQQRQVLAEKENLQTGMKQLQNDTTRYFGEENTNFQIEETKCIGGILSSEQPYTGFDKENVSLGNYKTLVATQYDNNVNMWQNDQTVAMEETRPIGGILSSGHSSNVSMSVACTNMAPSLLSSETVFMQETRPVEGLRKAADILNSLRGSASKSQESIQQSQGSMSAVSQVNKTLNASVAMEETKPVGGLLNRTQNQTVAMEETKPVGGLINRTQNQTVAMEETKPVGGLLNRTQNQTVAMEETKPVGGLLNRTHNQTVAMEETKPVGGLLNRTHNQTVAMECSGPAGNMQTITGNIQQTLESKPMDEETVCFEETRPIEFFVNNSNILDRSDLNSSRPANENSLLLSATPEPNITSPATVAMEMTTAVGGILCSAPENVDINTTQKTLPNNDKEALSQTLFDSVPMEETRAVGAIINKTSTPVETQQMDGISAHTISTLPSGSKDVGYYGDDQTESMEETRAIGRILNQTSELVSGKLLAMSTNNSLNNTNTDVGFQVDNETVAMEETKAVGGILDFSLTPAIANENRESCKDLGQTVAETVSMEETKAIGVILSDVNTVNPKESVKLPYGTLSVGRKDTLAMNESRSTDSPDNAVAETSINSGEQVSFEAIVDDEISFRITPKRPLERNLEDAEYNILDMTANITQPQSKLRDQTLREMQMCLKQTAAQVRAGQIKTPSKHSPNFIQSTVGAGVSSTRKESCHGRLDLSVRSPLHKRARVSIGEEEDTGTGKVDATAALLQRYEELHNTSGINDEEMPDDMMLTAESVCPDVTATRESTRSVSRNEVSVLSRTHEMSSFAPTFELASMRQAGGMDGPLTLEMFYELTKVKVFTLSRPKVRLSTFVPKIDMDDLTEVLHTELTVTPQVTAKKLAVETLNQHIERNGEDSTALQQSLEDTQPAIFSALTSASEPELMCIHEKLTALMNACRCSAKASLCRLTTEMYQTAVNDLQETSMNKARDIMSELRADIDSVDNMLASVDQDIKDIDLLESRLSNLKEIEKSKEREVAECKERLAQSHKLAMQQREYEQQQQLREKKQQLVQAIKCHILCSVWDLEEYSDTRAVFVFRKHQLQLCVQYTSLLPGAHITGVQFGVHPANRRSYLEDHVAQSFALAAISDAGLAAKYSSTSELQQLVDEVSRVIVEIERFCEDVKAVHYQHLLHFQDSTLSFDLWDKDYLELVTVRLRFDPVHPQKMPADVQVNVQFGNISLESVVNQLKMVEPGENYLSRLKQAVNFRELHSS